MTIFLENLIKALKQFRTKLFLSFRRLVYGLVEFLEILYKKLLDIIVAIRDYLTRLFIALAKVSILVLQVLLFYVPAILMFIYFYFFEGHYGWCIAAVTWFAVVTLAAIFYRENS